MRHIALASLTLIELPPPEAISAAAAAGYQGISITTDCPLIPEAFRDGAAHYSLLEDKALLRATRQRAQDTGLSLDLLEAFVVGPEYTDDACRRTMDVADELGIKQLAAVSIDEDRARMSDNLAAMCEMAASRGMGVNLEFMPLLAVRSLADTVALINEGKYPGLTIMVDALHL